MYKNNTCPWCAASLQGQPIPGTTDAFTSRKIGVERPMVYDGVLYWECPDCGGTWQRFLEGTRQYAAARPFIHA